MISTKTINGGGKSFALKLGTRAMMAIERETDQNIVDVLGEFDGNLTIRKLTWWISFVMNDGHGGSEDDAIDLIDCVGFGEAVEGLTGAIELAFPKDAKGPAADARETKPGKKPKAA